MNTPRIDAVGRAQALIGGLKANGLAAVVMSPGSRNAPLMQAVSTMGLDSVVALDEGSAAHHALGMSLALGRPVAVCCTSGTAALHHAPALAEAHRVGLPLISLTADRPAGAHDQWQSQTLVQDGVHAPHVRAHFTWPDHPDSDGHLLDGMRIALLEGPIHVNCPFGEPLYAPEDAADSMVKPRIGPSGRTPAASGEASVVPDWFSGRLEEAVKGQERILVLGGTQPDPLPAEVLANWSTRALLAGDSTSGLGAEGVPFISACDRWLGAWNAQASPWEEVRPDLIISFGAPLVSRRLKEALAEGTPDHIHIDRAGRAPEVFGRPARNLAAPVPAVLAAGGAVVRTATGDVPEALHTWWDRWWNLENRLRNAHGEAMARAPWSDLVAHQLVHRALPAGWDLHLGNSTPVRYAQLFTDTLCRHPWCNRGVAGIDGCSSTAVGAALAGRPTTLVTGELGFLYDANAFHVNPLPHALRIAVVHNGGGGIFRWLDGPARTGLLESHFEWRHDVDLRPLCDLHGLVHQRVESAAELASALEDWWMPSETPKVLEIVTDGPESAAAHRAYMEAVRG